MEADAVIGEVSRRKTEEDSSPEAADQKADETVAGAATAAAAADDDEFSDNEDEECSDEEDDPVIRNLNLMSKRNLMPPEWIDNRRKKHYEEIDMYNRAYDALENSDMESDDEAGRAEYEEWSKQLWASVDFSGHSTVGRESLGEDAVAVIPAFLCAQKEEDHDAAPAVAESSS